MKLCDVHKVSLLAPNPTTSPGPLSPSPIRQSAPGADTVVAPGIRPGDNRPRTAALVVSLTSLLLLLDVPALLNNINNNLTEPDLDLLFDALYPPRLLHQGDTENRLHQNSRHPV